MKRKQKHKPTATRCRSQFRKEKCLEFEHSIASSKTWNMSKIAKQVMVILLMLAMLVTMTPQSLLADAVISADAGETATASAQSAQSSQTMQESTQTTDTACVSLAEETSTTLKNPRIVKDSSMTAGQKVTWDCVWFGSYPQTEIVDKPETSGCYGKPWAAASDYKADAALYEKLKGATYDSNGDTTINGTKYRRIKESDATYSCYYEYYLTHDPYYEWRNSSTYHYFRYDPIKWRVLNVEGDNAFLLADKAIDNQLYNTAYTSVTWQTSTVRSWLNGYGSSSNNCSADYSSKNFIDSAFTSSEQSAIKTTSVVNKDNLYYGTEGGNGTYDKIFLLSESEVYTGGAIPYGFLSDHLAHDEARKCQSSAFAKAMGAYSDTEESPLGSCWWQLRSPGDNTHDAEHVWGWGLVNCYGIGDVYMDAVRPALNLNLLSSNLFSYAGTVCSDGTKSEVAAKKQENAGKTYAVTLPKKAASGTISASPVNAKEGDTVKLTVKANNGYKLKSLTVKTVNGKSVKLKTVTDGSKYSFTMPAADVTVEAAFEETGKNSVNSSGSFADVTKGDYFYDAVQWAYKNKIATGTDKTHFNPSRITNRAQAVTFLWRAAGEKKVNYKMPFVDVTADSYYEMAVRWACSKDITKGMTDRSFGSLSQVSRAQMVTFLWRMAGSPKVYGKKSLSFSDVSSDAYYYDAVNWAVSKGITAGTSASTFAPEVKCTRAQVVTFIYRYKK